MTTGIYLALETSGFFGDTVELSDQAAWRLPAPGWVPGIPLPMGNEYTDVAEEIPAEALGDDAAAVAARVQALAAVLSQGQRWAYGAAVNPALLRYTMPGSAPGKILSAIIKGWDSATFLDSSYNDRVKKTARAMTTVAIQRSGAMYHTAWTIENQATGTAWGSDPGWSGGASWHGEDLPSGGLGVLELASLGTYVSPIGWAPVDNATTYTLRFVAYRAGISPAGTVTIRLRDAGNLLTISNQQTISITNTGGWVVYTATLTTTAIDAAARIRIDTGADDVTIGELALYEGSGVTEDWHAQYAEHVATYTSSAAAQNPAVMTAVFPQDHPALSPMTLTLNRNGSSDYQQAAAYLLVATASYDDNNDGAARLIELRPWSESVSAPWTSPAEGNGAIGGVVKRFTPTSTAAVRQLVTPATPGDYGRWEGPIQAFASIRNNSATTQFVIYLELLDAHGVVIAETSRLVVPANATNPTWYPIGIGVIGRGSLYQWNVVAQASAASGTLDINEFCFIQLGPGVGVIRTDAINIGASNGYRKVIYDHQILEKLAPAVYVQDFATAVESNMGYLGAARLMASGETVAAAWLATSTGKWRHYDTGGVTLTQYSIAAERLPAYVTPE